MLLAPLLMLALPARSLYPGLVPLEDGLFAQVVAYDEKGKAVSVDFSRAGVRVSGPGGAEAARLVAVPPKKDWWPPLMGVQVERGPGAGWREATLDLTGAVEDATFPGGAKTTRRYYLPALDTTEADRALRERLVGKKLWILGSAAPLGPYPYGWDPREPATVLSVEREGSGFGTRYGSYAWDAAGGWEAGTFTSANPLRIRFRVPTKGGATIGNGVTDWHPAKPKSTEATIYVADPWHLDRIASTESPERWLRAESARVRNAFLRRELVKGMPRALVARLVGDPDVGEPREKVWTARRWTYWGMAPFSYEILFDASGRLSSHGFAGKLP